MAGPVIAMFAGEPSGDLHAAALLRELKLRLPTLTTFGYGGPKMAAVGHELTEDLASDAIMGVFPVIAAAPRLLKTYRSSRDLLAQRKPDLAVFVDYPGLNLRLAAAAKSLGIRTVGYIAPQVWAWGPWRTRRVARVLDRLLTILPFEAPDFERAGLPTTFTGHPMTDHVAAQAPDADFIASLKRDGASPRIGVFPGSRPHVIRSLAPVLSGALTRLRKHHGLTQSSLTVALAHPAHEAIAREAFAGHDQVRFTCGRATDVIRASDICLATSGTVTLEIATIGRPFVIAYRVSPLANTAKKWLLTIPHVGLVNLVAGRSIIPEHIGSSGLEGPIADDLAALWKDPIVRQAQLDGLEAVRAKLHAPGAYARAAEAVIAELPRR